MADKIKYKNDLECLIRAIQQNDKIKVKKLLASGIPLNRLPKDFDGPIHYAAMIKNLPIIKLLIAAGADINQKGNYGRTALSYAAMAAASTALIRFLIRNGADVQAKNKNRENALFELITSDPADPKIAALLIDSGIPLQTKHRHYGTALHWAAFCGRLEVLKVLVKKGANIHALDQNKEPPMVKAFAQGNTECIKYLFKHGADPESRSASGYSLLQYAAQENDEPFAAQITEAICSKKNKRKANNNPEAFIEAAKNGNNSILSRLLNSGIDINCKNKWLSETALMKAAYHGKKDTVLWLLEQNADVSEKDARGNTALHHAAWSGHTEIAQILLDHHADIQAVNTFNWDALMQSCVEGRFECAQYLIQKGAVTNRFDSEKGATALTLAMYSGNKKLIDLLKSTGAQERKICRRKNDEPYFFIADCGICTYIPHKKDLGRIEVMENIAGLETIHIHNDEPDRYTETTNALEQCSNCGTYYHQFFYIDIEDAFVGGPHIQQNRQRCGLLRVRTLLRTLALEAKLEELENSYLNLIGTMKDFFANCFQRIIPNHLAYFIESLTDYWITRQDWKSIQDNLLNHRDLNIGLNTADDLITIYGQRCSADPYPWFTYYRDYTAELQAQCRDLIQNNKEDLFKWLSAQLTNTDNTISKKADKIIEAAKYHNIFK